ncbi:hypothetical protein VFPPC_17972 [Pochonia chlamydosporia 170]|uniref:Uncharacterized protein n=1 Tax=Pochonia chlamydosporia 170 TaxID=1380566 RepID=A0A219ARL6_METCM|nr:hypothetical protein VFPPC_17972 [Pochonia chlamydosporia 170]OWT42835.1 hypothetical protein VFPPC_17972 [Pochonia chlamydosporia 170]
MESSVSLCFKSVEIHVGVRTYPDHKFSSWYSIIVSRRRSEQEQVKNGFTYASISCPSRSNEFHVLRHYFASRLQHLHLSHRYFQILVTASCTNVTSIKKIKIL